MATINDIMTREVATIELDDTLQNAAQRMRELNIGALPVTDEGALVGMMTAAVQSCSPTDSVDAVLKQMGDAQLRRLAVLDRHHKIAGIVALADLVTKQSAPTDAALREISQPGPTA